jgi:signal transduction histidine kinase
MSLVQDITEKKKAEEILKRDKQTLEKLVIERTKELLDKQLELEQAKRLSDIGTLAATVAHELRNPLAAIKLAAHNIKRKAETDIFEKHLHNIDKKVDESNHIINNLLFYSRLKTPHFGKVDLCAVVSESLDSVGARHANLGVNVQNHCGADITLTADVYQMKELFNNILNNAFEAVPEGNGFVTINIVAEGGFIRAVIADNGSGIPEEIMNRIYEPFFSTKAKGTGLGLAVCSQIVKLHKGSINIKSELQNGTTVTINLPVENS